MYYEGLGECAKGKKNLDQIIDLFNFRALVVKAYMAVHLEMRTSGVS